MEHTEKSKLFEQTYINLVECHADIKFTQQLTDFEENRAWKLINFCKIICEEFENDERFSGLFLPRRGEPRLLSDLLKDFNLKQVK
jgi:hypothetical protein